VEFGFFAGLCFVIVLLCKGFIKDYLIHNSEDKKEIDKEDIVK